MHGESILELLPKVAYARQCTDALFVFLGTQTQTRDPVINDCKLQNDSFSASAIRLVDIVLTLNRNTVLL